MESSNYPSLPDPHLSPQDQLKRMADHASVVQAMVRTPGWAVYVQAVLQSIKEAKDQALRAQQPHQMATHLGAALAMEALLDWPRRELEKVRLSSQQIELDSQT